MLPDLGEPSKERLREVMEGHVLADRGKEMPESKGLGHVCRLLADRYRKLGSQAADRLRLRLWLPGESAFSARLTEHLEGPTRFQVEQQRLLL